jgi:hypothetical protein
VFVASIGSAVPEVCDANALPKGLFTKSENLDGMIAVRHEKTAATALE